MTAPSPAPSPAPATGTGLAPNLAGALAYLLGPITGILFLVLEKTNQFVRFHAMQSTVLWIGWVILSIALSILSGVVPVIGWIFGLILSIVMSIGGFILWLVLMWKAYQGRRAVRAQADHCLVVGGVIARPRPPRFQISAPRFISGNSCAGSISTRVMVGLAATLRV